MSVNYFKCKYCQKTFVSITDRFYTCKYCGKKEGVIKMDFTAIKNRIGSIIKKPLALQSLSNKALMSFYRQLHIHYYIFRRMEKLGNKLKKEKIRDTIIEKITQVDLYINKELRIRKIKHRINDRLHKNTVRLIAEYNNKLFDEYVEKVMVKPVKYSDKIRRTAKFIVEPSIENTERIMIYKKDSKVKVFSENGEEIKNKVLLNKMLDITCPNTFILDAFLSKDGSLLLQDILMDELLLKRKMYLMKVRIKKSDDIKYIKFDYCKTKEELKKVLLRYKSKKEDCVLKPAMDKYNETKWIKLSFKDELKLKPAPDITENFIRWRIRNPNLFVKGSFRTLTLSVKKGIKRISGKLKTDPTKWSTQSVLFDKKKWTVERARKWINEHKESLKQLDNVSEKKQKVKIVIKPKKSLNN